MESTNKKLNEYLFIAFNFYKTSLKLVTSKIISSLLVQIIDRGTGMGVWVMMVMALPSKACSAHAVVTVTLLRLSGAITVVFT